MRNGAGNHGTGNHLGHPQAEVQKQVRTKGGPATDGNIQGTNGINEQSRRNRHYLQCGYYWACVSRQRFPLPFYLHSLLFATCLRWSRAWISGYRYRFGSLLSSPFTSHWGTILGRSFRSTIVPPPFLPGPPALSLPRLPGDAPFCLLCISSTFSALASLWGAF